MSKKEAIRNAANVVKSHGYTLPGSLVKMIDDIENPQYRVAVVGKYQVGKSALINKVFLGDKPLLEEGRGLCTTSVATDIEYGPETKLEVYDWIDSKHDGELVAKSISNPTAADVRDATVSNDMATRAELAKEVSRVVLRTPNESIRGYAVVDTPGLDDPEKELLLNTTYRIIPGADLALMIVEPRELSEVEMGILRNDLMGKNGISRLMVMVSYNARKMDFDAEQRKSVLETIRAQLKNIGREDIDVQMYCFDSSIEDIMSDISEIKMTIRSFLQDNALPGREEKLASRLRAELEVIQMQIAAQLKTIGASEAEVSATQKRVDDEVARFKTKCERAFENLKREFEDIEDQMFNDVDIAVEGVFDRFYLQLQQSSNLSMMQDVVKKAPTIIKADLQSQVSIIGMKLKDEINRVVNCYASEIADINAGWNLFVSEEFGVKRPFMTKIPQIAIDILNTIVLNILLPGGWLVAIIAELVGRPIFDPTTWIVKKAALAQMKKALDESKGDVRQQIMDQIKDNFEKTFAGIKESIQESNKAQVAAIQKGMSAGQVPDASTNRAALESAKADIEAALAAL